MKKSRLFFTVSLLGLLSLSACDFYGGTPRPDYAIRVTKTAQGSVATPPACPSWTTETKDPYDNQPDPQFGCANARNLALMSDNPDDLVEGRALADARGVTSVGAIRRFDNDQTRGLVWTGGETESVATTTAASATSSLSGDITGGAGASSSSSAASSTGSAGASATTP